MPRALTSVLLIFAAAGTATAQNYTIATLAGGGPRLGSQSTNLTIGSYQGITGITVDSHGDFYITLYDAGKVYRFDPRGALKQIIGTGFSSEYSGEGGPAAYATLAGPCGLAMDSNDNLYLAMDTRVARVEASTGVITSIAGSGHGRYKGDGGPATLAGMDVSCRVAVDASGNVFIADANHNRVRKSGCANEHDHHRRGYRHARVQR